MLTKEHVQLSQFEALVSEYQKLLPFRLGYKDESRFMSVLNIFLRWFCPTFMTEYTTVIGNIIYFPSRRFIEEDSFRARRILAHELVHLLDQKRLSKPIFIAGYLFPQILTLGVLSFPALGWWALAFLLFLLPLPSPFRIYFETRAYAISLHSVRSYSQEMFLQNAAEHLKSWNYYKAGMAQHNIPQQILHWYNQAEQGKDAVLLKVLLIYELIEEI